MKNIKLTLLTIATILFLGITTSQAQDKVPQTVIIKTFEIFGGKGSKMVVTSPDGKSKLVELQKIDPGNYLIGTGDNNTIFQSEINQWKMQGFKLDGLSTSVAGSLILTTIILSKDE